MRRSVFLWVDKFRKPAQDLAKVPFYAETTSRATYTPKAMVPQKSMKPGGTLGNQKVQGDYNTTHDVKRWNNNF